MDSASRSVTPLQLKRHMTERRTITVLSNVRLCMSSISTWETRSITQFGYWILRVNMLRGTL